MLSLPSNQKQANNECHSSSFHQTELNSCNQEKAEICRQLWKLQAFSKEGGELLACLWGCLFISGKAVADVNIIVSARMALKSWQRVCKWWKWQTTGKFGGEINHFKKRLSDSLHLKKRKKNGSDLQQETWVFGFYQFLNGDWHQHLDIITVNGFSL